MNDVFEWLMGRAPVLFGVVFILIGGSMVFEDAEPTLSIGPLRVPPMLLVGLALMAVGLGFVVAGRGFTRPPPSPAVGHVHRIPAAVRVMYGFIGLATLLLGTALFDPLLDVGSASVGFTVFAAILGLALVANGLWFLAIVLRARRYTVFVSEAGIRMGGSSRWVPWSEMAHFRERWWLQRVDLLDAGMRRVGMVDYHLEDSAKLLEVVRDRVADVPPEARPPAAAFPRRFGSRRGQRSFRLVPDVALVALFVWFGARDGEWFPGLLMGLGFVALIRLLTLGDSRSEILQLDLADDELRLSTAWRTERVPRDRILDVVSGLDGDWRGRVARTAVLLDDGPLEVTPIGADPMAVYDALTRWKEAGGLPPSPSPTTRS